ncbi:MAG TPA: DNA replication and repair protein RecF [Candidatus Cloacimonadota bacterium]|nr:DNA replication and repair protein RecF [Candidatus Cloacimonadota bacterium]
MEIDYLKLINFRNFINREFRFEAVGALIHGRNGVGKTNLLEAISYFAFGKSFQNSKDAELINFLKAFFRLEGRIGLNGKKVTFSAAADRSKKIIKVDDQIISRISELYQYLKVVYFSPVDIEIVAGQPASRRNFIDQAVSQYSWEYITFLRNYHRVLKQRNALLKQDYNVSEKKSWDVQYVDLAIEIIKKRQEYLLQFVPLLQDYYFQISNERDKLEVRYKYSFPIDSVFQSDSLHLDAAYLKASLTSHLEDSEEQEKHYERSLCGPHLDDIEFTIDGHAARIFGSQGQKRSLAIAIRLVQAKLISQYAADMPILMFDDVLSDLDKNRAGKIMLLLRERHQIFIATPNKEIYRDFQLPEIALNE